MTHVCELHVHIEGCVGPEHMARWWSRSAFLFPSPQLRYSDPFEMFLAHLRFRYNFLNTPEAYGAVLADYARSAAASGVRYAEMQVNLALVNTWRLDLATVLDAMNEAIAALPGAPSVRYIIDLPWQFASDGFGAVAMNLPGLRQRGVVGIGFGGDERLATSNDYLPRVCELRDAGLKLLCHAGETVNGDLARRTVEELQPDRIAHGIAIADWISQCGQQSPPVDVCLSSNLALGVVDVISSHPLRKWLDTGVPFSLSSDDPAVFRTDLSREYTLAHHLLGTPCPPPTVQEWSRLAFAPAEASAAIVGR